MVLDLALGAEVNGQLKAADIVKQLKDLPDSPLKQALLPLARSAANGLSDVQRNVEAWYDAAMDRVAGQYKRYTLLVVFGLGLIVAAVTNADAIALVKTISHSADLHTALVNLANEASQHPEHFTADQKTVLTDISACRTGATGVSNCSEPARSLAELHNEGLPLGWTTWPTQGGTSEFVWWLWKVVGLLATEVALSMGAPFWFDVLNKVMVLRSTVKPAEKSPRKSSKA